ncbi:hypothetical protein Goari_004701 [Gossypium aridum]|uniref:50S ribosomal protein L14, chloroplastic n=1 Tax=Gossypium aridum TaxID=34290 RepID=A0A7J8Y5Y3_GOSAI|nr:hypothetical protein [Gossypium aridum]
MTIKNGKFLIDLPKGRNYISYEASLRSGLRKISLSSPDLVKLLLECRLDKDFEESRGTKSDSIEITGCTRVAHVYGGTPTEAMPQGASNCRYAYIGDVIIAVIKEAIPNTPLERSEMIRAVIVRTRKELKHDNGMIIQYDDNATVVIDQEGNPKGTRIFGAIARKLRQLNFTKIVSLAPEVYIS